MNNHKITEITINKINEHSKKFLYNANATSNKKKSPIKHFCSNWLGDFLKTRKALWSKTTRGKYFQYWEIFLAPSLLENSDLATANSDICHIRR